MPKLPPPPRSAQNRSGCSLALARSTSPAAVTTSADSRLSTVMPCLRLSQPKPPPSVSPATPVVELMPTGVARPWAWVASSKSASVAPPSTVARRRSGSTRTAFIRERSITSPPSHVALPAMLCPPPRTASSSPLSRANPTPRTTSAVVAQRAMTAGRRSIIAFQILRASSYEPSPGRSTSPPRPSLNPSIFPDNRLVMECSDSVSSRVGPLSVPRARTGLPSSGPPRGVTGIRAGPVARSTAGSMAARKRSRMAARRKDLTDRPEPRA